MTDHLQSPFRRAITSWCALASQMLGWQPGEFWQATPAELVMALSDRQSEAAVQGPSQDQIAQMLERETNG